MSYTKGKWEARPNVDNSWVVMSGNIVIAVFNRKDFPEWNEANARLIAAAPELLEACKKTEWVAMDSLSKWRCPTCMNSKKNGHRHDCKMKAAIAAAEGS